MEMRLHKAGVMSMKDFWHISPKHARAIWGNVEAVIHLGPRPNIPGGYTGAKIAFGRIPDAEDFY